MKGLALSAVAAIAISGSAHAQIAGSDGSPASTYHAVGEGFATGNAGATADEPERLWRWIDTSDAAQAFHAPGAAPPDLSYRLWNPGEPYQFGDQDALVIGWDGTANHWNDIAANAVYGYVVEFSGGAVPEPATWGLMIAGFGAIGGAMRRRSVKAAFV